MLERFTYEFQEIKPEPVKGEFDEVLSIQGIGYQNWSFGWRQCI